MDAFTTAKTRIRKSSPKRDTNGDTRRHAVTACGALFLGVRGSIWKWIFCWMEERPAPLSKLTDEEPLLLSRIAPLAG